MVPSYHSMKRFTDGCQIAKLIIKQTLALILCKWLILKWGPNSEKDMAALNFIANSLNLESDNLDIKDIIMEYGSNLVGAVEMADGMGQERSGTEAEALRLTGNILLSLYLDNEINSILTETVWFILNEKISIEVDKISKIKMDGNQRLRTTIENSKRLREEAAQSEDVIAFSLIIDTIVGLLKNEDMEKLKDLIIPP